jgi:hypothetical protein
MMTGDEERETPEQAEDYEPPRVEDVPAEDGPAVTAAGKTPPEDDRGPEWRPVERGPSGRTEEGR